MAEKSNKSQKRNKALRIVLISVFAAAAVLFAVCAAVVTGYLNKIGKIDPHNIDTVPAESEWFDTEVPDDFWEHSEIVVIGTEDIFGTGTGEPVLTDPPDPVTAEPVGYETTAPGPEESTPEPDPVPTEPADTQEETTEPAPVTTQRTGPTMVTLPYENVLPGNIDWTPVDSLDDEKLLNILIVGQDNGAAGQRTRTDSMMLFSINKDTGRMALVSFLRDMYVQIPGGYSANRLNTPYLWGGLPLLYQTLEVNFGVHVDYGFVVDFSGFTKIIDYLGGIDVTLTRNEADWLKIGDSAGKYHMDGALALTYVRIRKLDSDFGRTNRQRTVISAMYDKIKKLSLGEITAFLDVALPMLSTDMPNSVILTTLASCYRFMGKEIYTYKIPAQDAFRYGYVNGMAVILPDFARNRVYLKYYLGLE